MIPPVADLSCPLALGTWTLPGVPGYVFKDPLWFLALLAIPLLLWIRGHRRVPVLLVPFAAAWHRPSLASSSRWPAFHAGGDIRQNILQNAWPFLLPENLQ